MAITQRRQNISMSDFRSEFKGTSSGSISMSELVREDEGSGVGGTRNAGETNSSFASRLSNGQLPPHAVGIGHDLAGLPSTGTTPTYFTANPKTSTSNMAFSDYLGVSGSYPASKWGLAGYTGESFSNSGSATAGYIPRNLDYSNTVKIPGGQFNTEDGFNIHGGFYAHNYNGYRHIPLNTICAPMDMMFVIAISNSGANVLSSGVDLRASNGTTGTFTTAYKNSNNWTPNGSDFYEFQDGNDRNVFARAISCNGGETHASIKFYTPYSSSATHAYMVGVIRGGGNNSLTGPTAQRVNFSHIAASNNQEKSTSMGTVFGYGELVIMVAMSGYTTNNPNTNYNSNSSHMIKGELSNSSGLGPFAFTTGIYEEGISTDLKGGTFPTNPKLLYITSNPTDGLIFVARFNTKA